MADAVIRTAVMRLRIIKIVMGKPKSLTLKAMGFAFGEMCFDEKFVLLTIDELQTYECSPFGGTYFWEKILRFEV